MELAEDHSTYPFFTWDELAAVTGGCWEQPPDKDAPGITGVFDDSRKVVPGALFVAVKGANVDGHRFIAQAEENGATALCVSRKPDPAASRQRAHTEIPLLVVDDTLHAFHRLAAAHRRRLRSIPLIAVTGSSGKTSVRAMLTAVLEEAWPGAVLSTEGNTNNHFGVPRNVLRLCPTHRVGVIELGSNHPGEIEQLARIVQANVGVITNIGRAHLEFLGDLAGVAREKGALMRELQENGTAVLPVETPHADTLSELAGERRILWFGESKHADLKYEYKGRGDDGFALTLTWRREDEQQQIKWALGGKHQAANAAAAAGAATALGVPPRTTARGVARCRLPGMRMETKTVNGIYWMNDAYNANPDSMRAGIRWFAELTADTPPERRMLVLGDMGELGPRSAEEHRTLLAWVRDFLPNADLVVVGEQMRAAAAAGDRTITRATDAEAAAGCIKPRLAPGMCVFVKGSRSVRLETVVP